ncbi:MAG: lipoate--protein ligase [Bacteroidales bacterium]|nr:lipoate--protein ligase [Bacteroidales bacterium]
MLLIQQTSTNPYFNIASEEFLLRYFLDDIFILYRNEPSIIVGKHQNTLSEINLEYATKNALKVIRRLSGGGTVYHDLGNLNYTFIANGKEGTLVDFKKFTQPIINVLQNLGVDAKLGGKNDIRVGDKKISGNAEHVYKNRVLHHGTLLFSSNLDELNESIKINPNTYSDKAVKSIRSEVANISEFLKETITITEFADLIANHIKQAFPSSKSYQLNINDIKKINDLVDTKYSTWDWNYGYSPTYTLKKEILIGENILGIMISVDKGIIREVKLKGDFLKNEDLLKIEQSITDCPHDIKAITEKISTIGLENINPNLTVDGILRGLF